jgi:hypothetical protein
MQTQLEATPTDEEEFTSQMLEETANEKFVPAKYDL